MTNENEPMDECNHSGNCSFIPWLLFALLFLFVGCIPKVRTTYAFSPPATDTGKACIEQCDDTRRHCYLIRGDEYDACRKDALRKKWECDATVRERDTDPNPSGDLIQRAALCKAMNWYAACDEFTAACDAQFRACYSVCGGTVTETTDAH